MLIPVLLFVLGLVLLIKGGDWFVDGAVGLAQRFHIPDFLIGATIVSIGTTLPEVMVSSRAAFIGNGEIAYGNAIGSVICNTALIAAVTLVLRPQTTETATLKLPVLFFFISAVFYAAVAYTGGYFSRTIGICLLCIFAVYMFLTLKTAKNNMKKPAEQSEHKIPENSFAKDILLLAAGAVLIAVGANLLVENGTKIAAALGVPDSVIALTFVALGTSLPELITAITSIIKKHSSLSLGNIIGANLFNLVLVSGVAVTVNPFRIPSEKTVFGINASLAVDIPVMFAVMLLLCVPVLLRGKFYRAQGIALWVIYAAFCVFQFVM